MGEGEKGLEDLLPVVMSQAKLDSRASVRQDNECDRHLWGCYYLYPVYSASRYGADVSQDWTGVGRR